MSAGLCGVFSFLAACTQPAVAPAPSASPIYASLAASEARLDAGSARDLINGYRRNAGLAPVALDPVLMAEAQKQAQTMAAGGDVSKGARADITKRLSAAGLGGRKARESVSAGYFTISDAFSGWRGSPNHDATLRFAPATRMGIASVGRPGSRHNVYWAIVLSD
jgi:uncharacterized protein YkwD